MSVAIQPHPLAEVFPLLQGEPFAELVEDIRQQGLLEPITLYEEKILDGRNRYRACLEATVEPRLQEYRGDEPLSFVLSKNIERRHLSEDQRAMLAAQLKSQIAEELKRKADRARGEAARTRERDEIGRLAPVQSMPERPSTGPRHRGAPAREVAGAKVGVSGKRVDRAERIAAAAPELVEAVRQGTLTLAEAEHKVEARTTEQRVADSVRRYPFLDGVPSLSNERLLEVAGKLDGAPADQRSEQEDQVRRWCQAQRELVPQWRTEDEVPKAVDRVIGHLAQVNALLHRHGATLVASVVLQRLAPDNDIEIVRVAADYLVELADAFQAEASVRRIK